MRSDPGKETALEVSLGGRRIGVINRLAGERNLFSFDQEYVDDPDRPTLSLCYKARGGGIVTSIRATSVRVPCFFSNLLPEGHLRNYLAERAGVKPEREFFLLSRLGADLPGGVVVAPVGNGDPGRDDSGDYPESINLDEGLLRFSLAGVQLKFSAVMEASGGLTIPADGMGGSWIVKLPSASFPAVPENEYTMLQLARAAGIQVPSLQLVNLSEIKGLPTGFNKLEGQALAVKRFDRGSDGTRIHMEDFTQVFGVWPAEKYEHHNYAGIAAVLWAEAGEESTYEFVRRLAFSTLTGNGDMHLKNWSLLYPDGRRPVLSPAYDFVSTISYLPGDKHALKFGGDRTLEGITTDQVRRFCDSAGLPVKPVTELLTETAERVVSAWRVLSEKDLLPASMRSEIDTHIVKVARTIKNQK